jgi:hypothetical protein
MPVTHGRVYRPVGPQEPRDATASDIYTRTGREWRKNF